MFLWGVSVDSISCERALKVASRLYCVSRLGCNRPWESEGAVACVLDFVRHPLYTQRNLFSETGISMVNSAIAAAYAVRNNSEFDPWGTIGVEAGPVIADLKSCWEGSHRYNVAMVWYKNCCIISCWRDLAPDNCPRLWLRWGGRRSVSWGP